MNNLITSQRIVYIDSLKGFLILSVVMCHVAGYCMGIQADTPSFQHILFEFRNPPFFFISGFLAYKIVNNWKIYTVVYLLKKKIISILWPTMIFTFTLFYIEPSYHKNPLFDLRGLDIGFYWFTISLFIFFLFYYTIEYCFKFIRNEKIKSMFFLIIGILFYITFAVQSIYEKIFIQENYKELVCMQHWGYFFFFILGVLSHKYHKKYNQLHDNMFFIAVCSIIFILFNIFAHPLQNYFFNFFRITTYLTGTILIVHFFKKYEPTGILKEILSLTGRRTLDIYLIHYSILPLSVYNYTSAFRLSPMPLLEFVVTLLISIAIIGISLLISSFMRLSPISAFILLGDRKMLEKSPKKINDI